MKLVRIGKLNNEKPAVLIHDKYFDVSDYIHDFNESFFENDGIRSLENIVSNNNLYLSGVQSILLFKVNSFFQFSKLIVVPTIPYLFF